MLPRGEIEDLASKTEMKFLPYDEPHKFLNQSGQNHVKPRRNPSNLLLLLTTPVHHTINTTWTTTTTAHRARLLGELGEIWI